MDGRRLGVLMIAAVLAGSGVGAAQSLGTFRWQLEPFCNLVTLTVTQVGGTYRLEGTDNQCGAGAAPASAIGTAFLNPDGTIGMGLNIVAAPGGTPMPVSASLAMATLSGTWHDANGQGGNFTFTGGVGTGGSPRPLPSAVVPPVFRLRADGGFVAGGTLESGSIPASGPGTRLMWYPGKAAFRAGRASGTQWDDASVGVHSVATGFETVASGPGSTALGFSTTASGTASTALGANTTANGTASTALGNNTTASGNSSTALGGNTIASGNSSTAMGSATAASGTASTALGSRTTASGTESTALGSSTTASSSASTAMGNNTTASGEVSTALGSFSTASGFNSLAGGDEAWAAGSRSIALGTQVEASGNGSVVIGNLAVARSNSHGAFVFGDLSNGTRVIVANQPNSFTARAAGGVVFYTNPAMTMGVQLGPGDTDWQVFSDANSKHRFRDLDGAEVLGKLARMPIREWSYKAQNAAIRHVGPTAQDFHAAFGLGQDPLRIGTLDADGIALVAIQALEARTRAEGDRVQAENQALRAEIERLRAADRARREETDSLREALARLDALVAALTRKP